MALFSLNRVVALLAGVALPWLAVAEPPGESKGAVSAQAMLEPVAKASLSSQIAASILKVTVEEGGSFSAGQTLVQFDCAVPLARLAKAQAELRAEQKKLEVNLRMKSMVGASELEVAVSRANVERGQAEVGMARAESDYCEIKAPYAGRVVKRHVNAHDSVGKGDPLLDILDDSTLRVRLYIPAQWALWLQSGARFTVTATENGEKTYPAKVVALSASVDPSSQTLGVIGEIQGPTNGLLPGLNVTALFAGPAKP